MSIKYSEFNPLFFFLNKFCSPLPIIMNLRFLTHILNCNRNIFFMLQLYKNTCIVYNYIKTHVRRCLTVCTLLRQRRCAIVPECSDKDDAQEPHGSCNNVDQVSVRLGSIERTTNKEAAISDLSV